MYVCVEHLNRATAAGSNARHRLITDKRDGTPRRRPNSTTCGHLPEDDPRSSHSERAVGTCMATKRRKQRLQTGCISSAHAAKDEVERDDEAATTGTKPARLMRAANVASMVAAAAWI